MNFKRIVDFSQYQPLMDEDPQSKIDTIIETLQSYSGHDYREIIQRTYDFTKSAHEGIYRLSGEAYITHPVQVASILMDLKPDVASIQAAILHDVIEDTEYSYDDIKDLFGEEVALLCEGLVKVKKVKYKWEDTQLETIKKTFLAMAQDLRVILIKIADRIHNMQTIVYHPNPEKQERIALETMKIYVPVCKRLGLYQYQFILENLCFKVLDPESFVKVFKYFQKYFHTSKKDSEKGIEMLTRLLKKEWIQDFTVKGRIKSPYRVYEKMTKKYQSWDLTKIMDLFAFRIITKDISDCYSVLGIIHKHYTPLINKIKDYIAVPKFNGYKSIHTTILGFFRLPTEIQIRTEEMDQIAEYWVAAHFAYSENKRPTMVNKKQSEWIHNLQNLVKEYIQRDESTLKTKNEFKDKLNMDILNKSTFLYTPKGDIVEIPRWGTVLDFAFYVHTDIWLKFKHAIVNGAIVPINHIPKTGDIVDIKVFRNKHTATKHWMEFVHSPSSKSKIARFLRQIEKASILEKMKQTLNKQLDKMSLPQLFAKDDLLVQRYGSKEIERKLLAIWDKKISILGFIKSVYPDRVATFTKQQEHSTKQKLDSPITKTNEHHVIIDEHKIANFSLCPECRPTTQDKIIAKTDKQGIKIHKVSCVAMKTVNFERLLEAHWNGYNDTVYKLEICFQVDTKINIIDMFSIIASLHIEITSFSMKNTPPYKMVDLHITWVSPTKMQYMINSLKKFWNSIKVIRKKIL